MIMNFGFFSLRVFLILPTRKHIPLTSLFPHQISESKLCSSWTFPPRWSSSVKSMDLPSSLDSVLLINVNLSNFLSIGNRAILSPWPAGWSLNDWRKSYRINKVWWQSIEWFKSSGVAKYRNKNCNRVILEKSLKEIRLDMDLKRYGNYFGLAIMGHPYWVLMRNEFACCRENCWKIFNVTTKKPEPRKGHSSLLVNFLQILMIRGQ